MSEDFSPEYWLRLMLPSEVKARDAQILLKAFHSPANILSQPTQALELYVPVNVAHGIARGPDSEHLDRVLTWLDQPRNHIVTIADEEYPELLLDPQICPPIILYYSGDIAILQKKSIAVLGEKRASPDGKYNIEILCQSLAKNGITTVTGLSSGIEISALKGGLLGGRVVAVSMSNLDIVFSKHERFARHISENGVLLSEHPPIAPRAKMARSEMYNMRNRLIIGLVSGCLIAEAELSGDVVSVARNALDIGRDVFAIPGSINSNVHRGCHRLIKEGAKLVETYKDILDEINHS